MAGEEPVPVRALLTDPVRLRKIDALREKNIGQHIPLPQLVVVGDQSSGKSSLLENLTGIPFPRGQERCTRYATQITSRREDYSRIDIMIIPSPHAGEKEKEKMQGFSKQISSTEDLRAMFPAIIDEVNVCMDIRTSLSETPGNASKKVFSEDVLKIEISGPDADYLTVIDVPGIFSSIDEHTTESDKTLVRNMVTNYIKDERTIILAVLPSNVDVQTQGILDLAAAYDKDGERTLGILTKVDLLGKEKSSKIPVCNLVLGKKKPLLLGYYLIRSRGGDEDETVDVSQKEIELFRESPWSELPRNRLGIEPLRAQLQELLGDITNKSLPKMRTQCRQLMMDAQRELESLGDSRQTEKEQLSYLTKIASRFQDLVRAALAAQYSQHAAFEGKDSLRLITYIVNLSQDFAEDFQKFAHTRQFIDSEEVGEPEEVAVEAPASDPPEGDLKAPLESKLRRPSSLTSSSSVSCVFCAPELDPNDYPDLEGIIASDWTLISPKKDIMSWIEILHYKYRGAELGGIGPGILSSAFREQSEHWGAMAHQYLSHVVLFIHQFVTEALAIVCPESQVRDAILSGITEDLLTRYKAGIEHAKFLVSVERDQQPYTLNHYFNDNLQVCRAARISNILKPKARREGGKDPWEMKLVVNLDEIEGTITDKSNAQHMQEDIHDILKSYYKVARKRFVDNLYKQAVSHFLLSGPDSPLSLFCEQWAVMLDKERLEAIVGEPRRTREKRDELRKKIDDLGEAIKIMR